MKILVTGAAGFIGFHVCQRLMNNHRIIGLDNLNKYYDVNLKFGRLMALGIYKNDIADHQLINSKTNQNFHFIKLDIVNDKLIYNLFEREKFDAVIHLAAQAGVRYSISNPRAYINSNISGFFNILDACAKNKIKHLLYASSSSIYGANKEFPFSTSDKTDHPVSIYAATKKSNELLAYSYSNIYRLKCTGLRFFTVYGPWGRPDMAIFLFTKAIFNNKPIKIFNQGNMQRDFTYVDDIVTGISKIIEAPKGSNGDKDVPHKIYNIGNNKPMKLMDLVECIENATEKVSTKEYLPMQLGDVPITYANVDGLKQDFKYNPNTELQAGVDNFVQWFRTYYKV